MMAKLRKGGDFRGCVNYVTRAKKDNPDGSPCDEWRLIDAEGVATYGGREEIIASFEDNQALNPKLKNVVGHFSLNFHANDKDKINDRVMVEIAHKYMERMGIVDTPFIIVRHLDKDYPHCHLVFSRVDNHGETISDKNDFNRNRKVCLDLTKEYGLHISEGKAQTKVNKLRGSEKTRYEIFNAVNDAWNDKGIYTFEQFENRLTAVGVGVEYKYRRGTNQVQGLWFTRKGKKFPASKIDRKFSFANLSKHLSKNTPLHPKSEFMFIDGTIRPVNKLLGVRLTAQQVNDYVSGKTIRLDGCTGNHSTVFVKFDRTAMRPCSYLSNPDSQKQTAPSNSVSSGHSVQPSSPQEEQGFAGGGGITWPEYRAAHMDLPVQEALRRFRAIKRGQNPNTMTGGMHM